MENTVNELLRNSYYLNEIVTKSLPAYVIIEPTNICNINCSICPRNEMTREQGFMDFALFKKIIDEIQGKTDFIVLHFFGESFLHEDIFKFINYSGGKGMTVVLSTNALLFDDYSIENVLSSNLDVLYIHVDSLNKGRYSKIRVGGNFDILLKNTKTLINKHKESNSKLNICIRMINLDLSGGEFESLKTTFDPHSGIYFHQKALHNFAGQIKIHGKESDSETIIKMRKCVEPWRGMVIAWNGKAFPCCNDYNGKYLYGDINNSSVLEVWNSENAQKMRNFQINGLHRSIELCKKCYFQNENLVDTSLMITPFNPSLHELSTYCWKGVYPPEYSENVQYMWTNEQFELLLQDRFHDITICMINDHPLKETMEMKVILFDEEEKEIVIERKNSIKLRTPKKYKGKLLRYSFSLSSSWVPNDFFKNGDNRRLGVRIENIIT